MERTHATNGLPVAEAAPSLDGMVRLCEAAMADVNSVILEKMGSEVPLIPELAGHLIAAGGKRMRPMLTLMGPIWPKRNLWPGTIGKQNAYCCLASGGCGGIYP